MPVKLTNTGSSAARDRKNKNKNKHKSFVKIFSENRVEFIIYGAFVVFLIYTAFFLLSQHNDIDKKNQELEDIRSRIVIEEVKNEEVNDILNSNEVDNEAYIEKSARENLDFAYKDERIFVNVSGN